MKEVFQSSFHEKRIYSQSGVMTWIVNPWANGSIELEINDQCTSLDLDIFVEGDAHLEFFILNHVKETCTLNINIKVSYNASCKMGLLDFEEAPLEWNQFVSLLQEGAEFEILSGQLCLPNQKKTGNIEVVHASPHTYGNIRNFAVLSDNGLYEMKANGNISKGCKQAQSHQSTRVLTLGQGHSAKVTPLLLIDENDVKASHALSIGQPDEDQLYYLQSRGLTIAQALGLLSIGYFLPVIDMVKDEDQKLSLRTEMERKVGLYGRK